MKKTYIIPNAQVMALAPNTIIASSILSTSGAEGLGVGDNTTDSGITEGNVRSDSGWDLFD